MSGRIVVVGSVNVDLVVRLPRLPAPGETVGGGRFERHQGGKGANQAVAAARLGVPVEFIGAVGDDDLGREAMAALAAEGVGTGSLSVIAGAQTGVAEILVDAAGENEIAVAPGANAAVSAAAVATAFTARAVSAHDVVLVSHEIPTGAARAALAAARGVGARSIFNPAPASGLERDTIGLADVLTPNRLELAALAADEGRRIGRAAGGEGSERQARTLLAPSSEGMGPRLAIVVTLGAAGALVVERRTDSPGSNTDAVVTELAARRVEAIDSTGAGDAFNGALAAGWLQGHALVEAARRAMTAAALATTQSGAREGMPTMAELDAALRG